MLKEPESMEELVYFTKRKVGDGAIKAWVYREKCPKCGKALMGKPVDPKTGKVKIRAKEYICPNCGYSIEKGEYEDSLTCEIKYTCPDCKHSGETSVPFKWKNKKIYSEESGKDVAAKVIQFECEGCGKKIFITKKMKS